MAFGRTFLPNNQIFPTQVSLDNRPNFKPGGVTLDWATVNTAGGSGTSTATLGDGSTIYDNVKYLRYGQIITYINASGKYGPYDPSATDGRQTLTRGQCYIVNQTTTQYVTGVAPNSVVNDMVGGVFDEGSVFADRVLHSGTNTATGTLGPTLSNFNTAFPGIRFYSSNRIVP